MSNFENFVDLMEQYLIDRGHPNKLLSDITQTSRGGTSGRRVLCTSSLPVIDMDKFAKKGYRKIILPTSVSEDDTINTADAFMINKNNEWYLVEFKDEKITGSTKGKVLRKAYSNVYAMLDVLYSMRGTTFAYAGFDYDNPVAFFKNNVRYILVFSESKNPSHVTQMRNHHLKKERYLPEFMFRLQGYIFKEAFALTETAFEYTFLRGFQY